MVAGRAVAGRPPGEAVEVGGHPQGRSPGRRARRGLGGSPSSTTKRRRSDGGWRKAAAPASRGASRVGPRPGRSGRPGAKAAEDGAGGGIVGCGTVRVVAHHLGDPVPGEDPRPDLWEEASEGARKTEDPATGLERIPCGHGHARGGRCGCRRGSRRARRPGPARSARSPRTGRAVWGGVRSLRSPVAMRPEHRKWPFRACRAKPAPRTLEDTDRAARAEPGGKSDGRVFPRPAGGTGRPARPLSPRRSPRNRPGFGALALPEDAIAALLSRRARAMPCP